MPYTSPATVVTGTPIASAAFGNTVKAALDFLANPPRAQARRTSTQSITSGAWNLVTFTVEDVDSDNMFTTGSGDRFTATTAGRYEVIFSASFTTNSSGVRGWAIAKGTTG